MWLTSVFQVFFRFLLQQWGGENVSEDISIKQSSYSTSNLLVNKKLILLCIVIIAIAFTWEVHKKYTR